MKQQIGVCCAIRDVDPEDAVNYQKQKMKEQAAQLAYDYILENLEFDEYADPSPFAGMKHFESSFYLVSPKDLDETQQKQALERRF